MEATALLRLFVVSGTLRSRQLRVQPRTASAAGVLLARQTDLRQACVHFADCPGCSVGKGLHEPPVLARAREFFRTDCGLANLPSVSGAAMGWRTHAKLAVRGSAGSPLIGLFKARSHDVLEIRECAVHHPSINAAVVELAALMASARTSVYSEAKHSGLVRYVQLSVERSSGTVQLVLICNAPAPADAPGAPPCGLKPLLQLLAERMEYGGSVWHSVWVHFNDERRNNILSYLPSPNGRWLLALGPPVVREKIGTRAFDFPPFVFRQANLDQFETIVAEVAACVPEGARVCELYAGIGLLGLNCLERAHSVRCSDVNPHLDEPVAAALAMLPTDELRSKVRYRRLDAADSISELCGADTLIVDPPRKGLDAALLRELCAPTTESGAASEIGLLAYVSCGYDALERDARALVGAGWRVRSASAHVLFPGADHIETVAIFERQTRARALIDAPR